MSDLSTKGGGLMTSFNASPLIEQFGRLEDPRIERRKLLRRQDIVDMSVWAVICGADNGVEAADSYYAKKEWWSQMLDLQHGFPCHDTFDRIPPPDSNVRAGSWIIFTKSRPNNMQLPWGQLSVLYTIPNIDILKRRVLMSRSRKKFWQSDRGKKKPQAKPKLKISFWGSASRDPREVLQHPDMQKKLEEFRSVSDRIVNPDDA